MENEHLSELLKKYLRGACTPEEVELIDKWFLSHEENPDDDRLINAYERERLEDKMFSRIKANVQPETPVEVVSPVRSFSTNKYLKIAASISILLLAGITLFLFSSKVSFLRGNQEIPLTSVAKFTNNTQEVVQKVLSDGTVIMLHPNGSIEYPEIFPLDKREIVLAGEAFFDVTKDKNRPFIINTGDVTIRVLGTSFNVKAYQGAKEITVAVKSGKVSVYAKKDNAAERRSDKEEIILTPNQEVVYNTIDENFSKKIVDDPQIILEKPTLFAMEYDETPVAKIFRVMEENYGIDIVYDEQDMAMCSLTTSMSEEGLYERIEIICQAIGAKYEIKDAKILVSSSGCQ
jgi:transmembrane sensor